MPDSQRADARLRDLIAAVLPVLLMAAGALAVFLVRQVWGPSRSVETALRMLAVLPVIGLVLGFWSSWTTALGRLGVPATPTALRLAASAVVFTAVAALSWVGPWFVVRRVVDLASPFESMKWILTLGIILQGLIFRAILSARRVPAWLGVVYWLACAGVGFGLWYGVTGIFS